MSFWRRIFGPRSKYDRRLPYTYEARVTVSGVDGMSENYQADTLCALLERLAAERGLPGEAGPFAIRPPEEGPIAGADRPAASHLGKLFSCSLDKIGLDIANDNVRARLGEATGDCLAEPLGSTCYDSRPSRKRHELGNGIT